MTTQYGFFIDSSRCTGCKTCELACKDFKDLGPEVSFRRIYAQVALPLPGERQPSSCYPGPGRICMANQRFFRRFSTAATQAWSLSLIHI